MQSLTPIYDQLRGETLATFPHGDHPADSDPEQVDPMTRTDTEEEE